MDRTPKAFPNTKATEKYFDHEQLPHALYLKSFRVDKCDCKNEDCIKCHNNQKPRRQPVLLSDGKWSYIPKMCKNPQPCKIGNRCKFCHTLEEYNYHPALYKITHCKFPLVSKGKCARMGAHCSFAHSEADRRVKAPQNKPYLGFIVENFKTERCQDLCQQEDCFNFHSTLEKRRSPCYYTYSALPCSYVYKESEFVEGNNCPYRDNCRSAHSKNEIYYHPNMYKTKECNIPACGKKYCAFRHSEDDIQKFFNEIKSKSEESPKVSKESDQEKPESEISDQEIGESKLSTEDTSMQENNLKQEGKEEISISKLTCKQCKELEIKWVLECGAVLCGKCIGKTCFVCNKKHLTRLSI